MSKTHERPVLSPEQQAAIKATLETLYRYAAALGVDLKFAVDESAEPRSNG
jgi:hypothetical protein